MPSLSASPPPCAKAVFAKPLRQAAKVTTINRRPRRAQVTSAGVEERAFKACTLTAEVFKPFGQVLTAIDDSAKFGEDDAQLTIEPGQIPRFYLMRLPNRGLNFRKVTNHKNVTQCLGGLGNEPWYIAVAAPEVVAPTIEDVTCFEIPPGTFIKLECGTWHAGPLFDDDDDDAKRDFYNLECSDTNLTDAESVGFGKGGVIGRIVPPS